ncbi:hypothetical protein BJ742DRAFT_778660 [Cladochytrium replicatum]|nr:hypothetical protein BJ742DRAFT_778660 [Cladochytrium replicatum]
MALTELQINTIYWAVVVVLSLLSLAFTVFVFIRTEKPSITHKLIIAAAAIYVLKTVTPLVYGLVAWLPPQPRYVGVWFMLYLPHLILFYLYEVRLHIFVSQQFQRNVAQIIRIGMYIIMGLFFASFLLLTILSVIYAYNTSDGGYKTRNGPFLFESKVMVYSTEIALCFFTWIGTVIATYVRVKTNQRASLPGQSFLYLVILASDTVIFSIVYVIVVYKAMGSFDVDGKFGVLPAGMGNLGFQHFVDWVQTILMVVNLLIPSAVIRAQAATPKFKSTQNDTVPPAKPYNRNAKGKVRSSKQRSQNSHESQIQLSRIFRNAPSTDEDEKDPELPSHNFGRPASPLIPSYYENSLPDSPANFPKIVQPPKVDAAPAPNLYTNAGFTGTGNRKPQPPTELIMPIIPEYGPSPFAPLVKPDSNAAV